MAEQKFAIPTEMVDLPSKGLVYAPESPLSKGKIEMRYMTAKDEDILTNINNLRAGTAIEKTLRALIASDVVYEDLVLGDRNGLLIAARILGYGKDYQFKYSHPKTGEEEVVTVDLQSMEYKKIDENIFKGKNEFDFELPFSKNKVTFKLMTLADEKKAEEESKGLKKALGQDSGASLRLKYQITSVNGDYSTKTVRDFVDQALMAKDANALRQYMAQITPDIDTRVKVTFSDGEESTLDLPITGDFFFPGSGI